MMMEGGDAILVLNAGSSSIKLSVFAERAGTLALEVRGAAEGLYTAPRFVAHDASGRVVAEKSWSERTLGHDGAIEYLRVGAPRMSGISSDMRSLLASGEPSARLAIDVYVYRIRRELGSLAAALGGLDSIVFTGGIGEHAPTIRERVCRESAWLGLEVDAAANARGGPRLTLASSRVSAWVIPADEELMIARHTQRLLEHGREH